MKKIIFALLIFFALIGIGCVAAADASVAHNHSNNEYSCYHSVDGPSYSLEDPWGPYRHLYGGDQGRPGLIIVPGNPFDSWGSGNNVLI